MSRERFCDEGRESWLVIVPDERMLMANAACVSLLHPRNQRSLAQAAARMPTRGRAKPSFVRAPRLDHRPLTPLLDTLDLPAIPQEQ